MQASKAVSPSLLPCPHQVLLPQGGRSCTQAAHSAQMRRAAPTRGAQWHLVSTPAYTELPRLSLKVSHLWGPYLSSWLVLLPDPPIQQSAVGPPSLALL